VSFRDSRKFSAHALLEVVRREQVTPHMVRLTVTGDDLAEFPDRGYDQWFRMFLPKHDADQALKKLPERVDLVGWLKFMRVPEATRPVMRNYTVRAFRKAERELDIDFIVHGDDGVAAPWARTAEPGDRLAIIDQGTGFELDPAIDTHLLVGDETALPAILGILRDLPRHHRGAAYIELPDAADEQPHEAPDGVDVRWLARPADAAPGTHALRVVKEQWTPPADAFDAYLVGEQALATGLRRWLVTELKVPKNRVTFVGYWRIGKTD